MPPGEPSPGWEPPPGLRVVCRKAFAAGLAGRSARRSQRPQKSGGAPRREWAGVPLSRGGEWNQEERQPPPSNRLLVFVYRATRQVCLSPPSPFSLLASFTSGGDRGGLRAD